MAVVSPITRLRAISALDSPRTIRTNTSRSRSVSRSRSADVRGRPRTKCSTSRRIGPGETRASPAAAARTASKISSGGACFSRNPLAPASRPSKTYSSRSKVVSSTTRGGFGVSAATRLVASIPLSRGMRTSITTTSGLSSAALLTAASPSGASPTTSRSGCVPIIMATPARTTGWSSTTRMRMVTADPAGTRVPQSPVPRRSRPQAGRRAGGLVP